MAHFWSGDDRLSMFGHSKTTDIYRHTFNKTKWAVKLWSRDSDLLNKTLHSLSCLGLII